MKVYEAYGEMVTKTRELLESSDDAAFVLRQLLDWAYLRMTEESALWLEGLLNGERR